MGNVDYFWRDRMGSRDIDVGAGISKVHQSGPDDGKSAIIYEKTGAL